ncbi:uncharacterized protein LOC110006414 [Amborella trichopoda]|uniref:uncharacterized protein LOC110006414 n=1 Tax=Amborella trichopoda TaxID=13333 RepID=UPI0009BF954D|nr:uncharacterized protein LOC110006414 [Amborella trichopoda]|eukprot:XP_020517431.1 uncharacterized protein LOC110006414 [Amborella trichopoda]
MATSVHNKKRPALAPPPPPLGPDSPLFMAYADTPSLTLLPDQLRHCSEALALLKKKIQTPFKLNQEFDALQVNDFNVLCDVERNSGISKGKSRSCSHSKEYSRPNGKRI